MRRRLVDSTRTVVTRLAVAAAVATALVACGSTPGGEAVSVRSAPVAPVPLREHAGPTGRAETAAFLDELLSKEMATQHIAGAAVSVVKDGRLLFAKGYGYADLANRVAVDPAGTNFRIGSVAKLLMWTAVMQLVEQGKLNLDADVNDYLDFRIPATYAKPITLKNLLTHTAGFEDLYYERMAKDPAQLEPPRTWLISHMPARVRPPGELPAYSSYGAALAGYIVSRVSGESFSQYLQRHMLNPLGMAHTTAEPSMPPDIRAHTSLGYVYKDGAYQEFPDPSMLGPAKVPYADMGQPALVPAGDMQSSATDMARFMIAQLRDGPETGASTGGPRLLKATTLRQMHSTLYTPAPHIMGTAHGFFDFSDNGQRTIGHSGGSDPIFSLLLLLPDQHLGVFVVYNSAGGDNLTRQHLGFQREFFDHYYPARAIPAIQPPEGFAKRAGQFAGSYRITGGEVGTSYTTIEKAGGIFGIGTVTISNPADGTLLFTNPWATWRFVEERPLYFRQVDGPLHLQFLQDRSGHVADMVTDYTPMFAFEKLKWYETPKFNLTLGSCFLLMFLSVAVAGAVRLVRALRGRRLGQQESRGAYAAYATLVAVSLLDLFFLVGTMVWFNPAPFFGVPLIYKIVLSLGVVSAVLTLVALFFLVPAWKTGYWGVAARVHLTVVTLAAVAFIWFLNYWRLLGWQFHPK